MKIILTINSQFKFCTFGINIWEMGKNGQIGANGNLMNHYDQSKKDDVVAYDQMKNPKIMLNIRA